MGVHRIRLRVNSNKHNFAGKPSILLYIIVKGMRMSYTCMFGI